jgi:N-acyl-D-aspartate/D-glutamate deacylase
MGSDGPPRRRSPVLPRRLLLTGAFGACCAAAIGALPRAGTSTTAPTTTTPAAPTTALAPTTTAAPAEPPTTVAAATHDLVITGGRVIDPDSGTDALMDVGIDGAAVTALSAERLRGRTTIDATGMVVAPGFIDLLSYDPNPYGVPFKVADGVTTNLCMHGINDEPGPWFAARLAEPTPVHHGGAFDHAWARSRLGVGVHERAGAAQVEALRWAAAAALAGGFIGVHLELEYTPGVALDEVVAMASVAAASRVPALFHARHSDPVPPGTNAEALAEVVAVARATGAAVHVEHLTSTGGTRTMAASLATLQAARDEGLDVTGDLYPYDSWATYAGSTRFDPGWQERFGIDHGDLVMPGTSARLTPATFAAARRDNALVAAMAIPEDDVRAGLRSPILMLGSDAILEPGDNNHPRAAGTFARVLGRYVRDERLIGLPAALAKMTIQPARRLEAGAPAMRRKGRLSVGADADITVFDPATVADRATLERPAQASTGITWVLVDGVVVRDPDGPRVDARPGRAIRSGP